MPSQEKQCDKMVDLGLIDPRNLTEQQNTVLYQYLIENKNKSFFATPAGYSYEKNGKEEIVFPGDHVHQIIIDKVLYTFQLTHNIYYRPSEYQLNLGKNHPEYRNHLWLNEAYSDRFEIISNGKPLGAGGFGVTVKVDGTLAPLLNQSAFEYKNHIHRVAKFQKRYADKTKATEQFRQIIKETNIMSEFEYLKAKTSIFIRNYYITLMHQIDGVDGKEFIKNFENTITVQDILYIMIQMVKSLKSVHDKEYRHQDVKPGNFLIEDDKNARLIDFGLSQRIDDYHPCLGYTPDYVSPEQKDSCELRQTGIVNKKTDIYSLGKTFKEIIKEVQFKNPALDKKMLAEIENISNKMSHISELLRPSADKVLTELEKLEKLEKLALDSEKYSNIFPHHKITPYFKRLEKTIDLANDTRKEYNQYIKSNKGKLFELDQTDKFKEDVKSIFKKAFDAFEEDFKCVFYNMTKKGFDKKDVVNDMTQEEVTTFLNRLDIKSLNGLSSKEEIFAKIDDICNIFEKNLQQLLIMANTLKKLEINDNLSLLAKEIPMHFLNMKMLDKYLKSDINLDNMYEINRKSINYLNTCEQQYQISPGKQPNLNQVVYLLCQINSEDGSQNYHLIEDIKEVIIEDIRNIIKKNSLENNKIDASQIKINNMYNILSLLKIHANDPPQQFVRELQSHLKCVKDSSLNFFGKVELKDKISNLIQKHEKLSKGKEIVNDPVFNTPKISTLRKS